MTTIWECAADHRVSVAASVKPEPVLPEALVEANEIRPRFRSYAALVTIEIVDLTDGETIRVGPLKIRILKEGASYQPSTGPG